MDNTIRLVASDEEELAGPAYLTSIARPGITFQASLAGIVP
jgi:hypothetical protein